MLFRSVGGDLRVRIAPLVEVAFTLKRVLQFSVAVAPTLALTAKLAEGKLLASAIEHVEFIDPVAGIASESALAGVAQPTTIANTAPQNARRRTQNISGGNPPNDSPPGKSINLC